MRARVTTVTWERPVKRLMGDSGIPMALVPGRAKIDFTVVEEVEEDEVARIMDREVIVATLPDRHPNKIDEASMAEWADLIASGYEGGDLAIAAGLLLPEVIALRREVATLHEEVAYRRARAARPLVDKLREVAAGMGYVVVFDNGEVKLEKPPPDDDARWDD